MRILRTLANLARPSGHTSSGPKAIQVANRVEGNPKHLEKSQNQVRGRGGNIAYESYRREWILWPNPAKRYIGGIGRTLMKLDDGYSWGNPHGLVLPEDTSRQEIPNNVSRAEREEIAPGSGPLTEKRQHNRMAVPPAMESHVEGRRPRSLLVGYAAGAYDLFHIGHLNILRQARQRCDYLIAGVVSDEMLRANKGIEPFIPEDERLAIVQSIEFVDEAILEDLPDKLETWKILKFNVFFKGDDWRGTAKGQDLEERFGKVGVDVEYLPYTLHTSSTKLRMALDNFERIARSQ